MKDVLAARVGILAETIIRTQNILIAHQRYADESYSFDTQMAEYEQRLAPLPAKCA